MYDGSRYEVECKYTQFVQLVSRPVWPRLDMAPLAAVLNTLEASLGSSSAGSGQQQQQQQQQGGGHQGGSPGGGGSSPAAYPRCYGGGTAAGPPPHQQGQQGQGQQQQQQQQQQAGGAGGAAAPPRPGGLRWVANSLTDTGVSRRRPLPHCVHARGVTGAVRV
jgi:hypothetical protein